MTKRISALCLLIATYALIMQNCLADELIQCLPIITSSSIKGDIGQPPNIIISGPCLEKVTHVTLAKDEGDGLENIFFTKETNPSFKIDIVFPSPDRANASFDSMYLLQLKICKKNDKKEICTITDSRLIRLASLLNCNGKRRSGTLLRNLVIVDSLVLNIS